MQGIITTIANFFTSMFTFLLKIFEWMGGIFKDFMNYVDDIPIKILEGFLNGVIYILGKIPTPDFLTQYSLQSLFAQLPDVVTYFVGLFGIPQALLIIGAGVAFRLTRKALTLGQW